MISSTGIDNISLNIESNLDIIHRGDNVELRCHISGNADLPISWQRIGGTFDSNVIMTGSLLRYFIILQFLKFLILFLFTP